MSVLTPETMLTARKLPECSPEQLATLNLGLLRALQNYEFGTDAYFEFVAEFHDRAIKRFSRSASTHLSTRPTRS